MPRYAPLPKINLDPRSESELVAAAAQRVFEASQATINDFSPGSPVMALLEGQAFAQAEFLQFANEFPEAVILDWIGPFLGAQRRTGAGSNVLLTFEIEPRDQDFIVFQGYEATTDPALSNGETVNFVTINPLVIPAGQSEGSVEAVSAFVGVNTNVAANSITRPITNLSGVTRIYNREASTGGEELETISEVKERFFSLIRRRNPVSAEDWEDFFTDALGVGCVVNVLPNRSEKEFYTYDQNNPFISFFLLNPGGIPLTNLQISSLENLIKWSLPIQYQGKVYPIELNDLDAYLEVAYSPDSNFSRDLLTVSKVIKDNLTSILLPNAVFPPNYQLKVNEIGSKLELSFIQSFGNSFDPTILKLTTYFTPNLLSKSNIFTNVLDFTTDNLVKKGDLIREDTGVESLLFEVLQDFSPTLGDEFYHANLGDLNLKVIKDLSPQRYLTGDVISVNGSLYVVKSSFLYSGSRTLQDLVNQGLISTEKLFSPFEVGSNYQATTSQGEYDPQIFEFNPGKFPVYEPQIPVSIPLNRRVGYLVWVVSRNFTRVQNTTSLGTSQNQGLVSQSSITPRTLRPFATYEIGSYVETPNPNSFLNSFPNPESCYLDLRQGFIKIVAIVNEGFTFRIEEGQTFKEVFDSLVESGVLKPVNIVPFIDCNGEGVFALEPFRYSTRFSIGEYVRFRPQGGFDSSELEKCIRQSETCASLDSSCKKLLERELPLPSYFLVTKDFTPNTTDVNSLIDQGFITPVSKSQFFPTYTVVCSQRETPVTEGCISNMLFSQGIIDSISQLIPGQVTELLDSSSIEISYYVWDGSNWIQSLSPFPKYRELFRYSPGDVASFRQRGTIFSYEATSHVTPITDIGVYYKGGVFLPTDKSETVKYFDPLYQLEDICLQNNKFFRVTRPITPSGNSTPEQLEISGEFQKIVTKAEGNENIYPRLDPQTSMIILGNAQIALRSKGSGETKRSFVWGKDINTVIGPEKYGKGTLAL